VKKESIKPMTPGVPQAARTRAYAAGVVVMLGLVGVGYKAWALQIDEGDKYRELAARQHAMSVDIPGPRGEVVDTHGRPLAVSADADSVWANPREVRDVLAIA
jgi:cell division protein FtsI/penicillin-binding protein 2